MFREKTKKEKRKIYKKINAELKRMLKYDIIFASEYIELNDIKVFYKIRLKDFINANCKEGD